MLVRPLVRALPLAIVFTATATAADLIAPPACLAPVSEARVVARIIDAATIAFDDGGEARLAGVLLPTRPLTAANSESGWAPEQEAMAALSALVLGQTVELSPSGTGRDRYGRRGVHLTMRRGGSALWVQGELLRLGHVRALAGPGDARCLSEMLGIEIRARREGLGLWRSAAYAIRSAERPIELMRFRSTYQIVEGVVAAVGEVRGAVYINFGKDWRTDFTAGLSRRRDTRASFAGFHAKSLEGKRIRVRGWIERRGGPFVEIFDPAQIEVLDPAGSGPGGQADGGELR